MVDGSDIDPQTGDESPVTRFTTWSYGDLGRTVTETRPDGATITRDYDDGGHLTALAVDGNTLWQATYNGGRLAGIARGNVNGVCHAVPTLSGFLIWAGH